MSKREAFCAVRERNWAFSRGVKRSEDVDEQSNQTEMSWVALGNEEAQPCSEQRPCHLWEGEEKQAPATKCVDSPDGRPSKYEVDKTKPK